MHNYCQVGGEVTKDMDGLGFLLIGSSRCCLVCLLVVLVFVGGGFFEGEG